MSLSTLVYHVSERTPDFAGTDPVNSYTTVTHIPDVSAVYAQIVAANAGKVANIVLLPEYNGNEVFADFLAWVTANFGGLTGVPIMLTAFEGGPYADHVVTQLTTDQILQVMAVANVKWLRFFEVKSWYIAHTQTFPTTYVATILAFCKTNNLKVFWAEYKVDHVFQDIQGYIVGFEDVVTVSFDTNSGELEPVDGFNHVKGLFAHWGGSVQSWYWETRHRLTQYLPVNDPENMPVSWLVQHACLCRDMGAEVIEFEPYWYFFGFTDGKARDSLKTLHYCLNDPAISLMSTSLVVLQTILAEWMNGPDKAKVKWLDGKAESGWDFQPSAFDFKKMLEAYAVTCYSLGAQSPSSRIWLKKEVVAVEILVKLLGTTQEKAALTLESMRVEVERIIKMYDILAPLWNTDYTYANGSPCRRRIPGFWERDDVMISRQLKQTDANYARVIVQVTCKIYS